MIKRTDSENSGISVFPSTKKLSVQVSLNGLSFSVLDAEASRLVTAGTHWFPRTASEDTLQDQVTAAMEQFDLISPSFDRIQLIYQSDRFALVPAPFFEPSDLPHYLKLNARLEPDLWPRYESLAHDQIINVYLSFPSIDQWFARHFEWVETRHSGSILIDSFINHPHWDHRPHGFVRVGLRTMEVVLIHNQALIAYTIFPFTNQDDFLYYLLMLLEQSQLDPEEVDVNLFGQIDSDHPLYKLARRYIRNIHILDPDYRFEVPDDLARDQLDYTVIQGF